MADENKFLSKVFQNEVLKVIILVHLSRHEGYPYALLKAVQNKKVWILQGVVKSDLYNTMNSLEKQGFIRSRTTMKGAVARKNYVLTPKGRRIVSASRRAMARSFNEVIEMMREE
jgi:DNA-binding PadR family transcriptional regulator